MPESKPSISRRAALVFPLAIAGIGGAAAWRLLGLMEQGTYDPRALPSALVGKKLPGFDVPALATAARPASAPLTSAEIVATNRPVLVNFFASWCAPCVEEAPVMMRLKVKGVPIYGIAYKDNAVQAERFLEHQGNPYVRVGSDIGGAVGINFGLYGVPETYAVDSTGVVRHRWTGPMTDEIVRSTLFPLLKRLA
jgi:cytochrome c biogenesis protein CcmG/thiol:disulfide interchange protein DsbE